MDELSDLVPKQNRGTDAAGAIGKAALSAIPFAGPIAAEGLAYFLDGRQAARQNEFNQAIATALGKVMDQAMETVTLEQVVASDEFIASINRAQRLASESASEEKRRWLAASVANCGSWSAFSETERQQFARLVEDLDPLHVWLLHYFQDPAAWMKARGLYEKHSNLMLGGIDSPLESAFGAPQSVWGESVGQAAADLEQAGLASIPLKTTMSVDGIFASRTSGKGKRFLLFIDEPDSIHANAPGL